MSVNNSRELTRKRELSVDQAITLFDLNTTFKVFLYTVLAVFTFNLLIFGIDSLAYGALLLNVNSAYKLRQSVATNIDGGSTARLRLLVGENESPTIETKNAIEKNNQRKLKSRMEQKNLLQPLVDQAIACNVPKAIMKPNNTQTTDSREDIFRAMIDLFPLYVSCAMKKTTG